MSDFYEGYANFKSYSRPDLRDKHIRRFDDEIWAPAVMRTDMSVLEIGCGTGLFLAYLDHKGIGDYLGLDQDAKLAPHIPAAAIENFKAVDVLEFLADGADGRVFDRIVLMDVLEHFSPGDGRQLLLMLSEILTPAGRMVLKVPNAASPWGAQYQYGDLTHKCAFTPGSMRQMAEAAGLRCASCYGQHQGSPVRRVTDGLVHGVLNRLLMTPPEIWTANFYAILEKRN